MVWTLEDIVDHIQQRQRPLDFSLADGRLEHVSPDTDAACSDVCAMQHGAGTVRHSVARVSYPAQPLRELVVGLVRGLLVASLVPPTPPVSVLHDSQRNELGREELMGAQQPKGRRDDQATTG